MIPLLRDMTSTTRWMETGTRFVTAVVHGTSQLGVRLSADTLCAASSDHPGAIPSAGRPRHANPRLDDDLRHVARAPVDGE